MSPIMEYTGNYLEGIGLQVSSYAFSPNAPCIVARYRARPGRKRRTGSVVLSCHLDTAGYDAAKWRVDPLSAEEVKGRIFGRGAIDCKGLAAVWLSLLGTIVAQNEPFPFDLIFVAVTDEENSGGEGLARLIDETHEFDTAFLVLGEGGGIPLRSGNLTYYTLQTGEMERWNFKARPTGNPYASRLPSVVKGFKRRAYTRETLCYLIRTLMGFHDPVRSLASNPLEQECSEGLTWYRTAFKQPRRPFKQSENLISSIPTGIPGASKIGLSAVRKAIYRADRKARILPLVTRGFTDNRYFRLHGIPTFGFFPLAVGNSITGCHGENEYISIKSLHFAEQVLGSTIRGIKEEFGG